MTRRSEASELSRTPNGWSASENFIIKPGESNSQNTLGFQANFPAEGPYTAKFSVKTLQNANGGVQPRVRCEIIWSVQGNNVRRLMDVVSGGAISGEAQGFAINVVDNSLFFGGHPNEVIYQVSALVAPGIRPNLAGSQPPVVLGDPPFDNDFVVNAGDHVTVPIPLDAGVNAYYLFGGINLFPIPEDPTLAPLPQLLISQVANSVANFAGLCGGESLGKWVPLVPGATAIRIANFNPAIAPFAAPAMHFTLLFGVEG